MNKHWTVWDRKYLPDIPGSKQRRKRNSRIANREAERAQKHWDKLYDYDVVGSLEHEYVPKGTDKVHKTPAYKARVNKRMYFKNLNNKIRGKEWIPKSWNFYLSRRDYPILNRGQYRAIGILPFTAEAPEFLMPGDEFIILLEVFEREQKEIWNSTEKKYDVKDVFYPPSKPPVKDKLPKRWQLHKLRRLERSQRKVQVYDRHGFKSCRDY